MKGDRTPGSYVLGLTRTESRVGIKVQGRMLSDPASGYECVAPRLDITLSYLPIVVYIGREFAPGTCSYREILAHEMRHLATYLDLHAAGRKDRARGPGAPLPGQAPVRAERPGAQTCCSANSTRGWMPFIKNEMAKVERMQAAIDTPQEYARLGKVCAGEVQSLIRPAQRKRTT